jgi:hypothetical protein
MNMPSLDPFRSRQTPDVAGRFLRERDRHQRQANLMWTGMLVAMFSDRELGLLNDLGYLSRSDLDKIEQAGRRPESAPAEPVPYTDADRSYDLHAVEADYGREQSRKDKP